VPAYTTHCWSRLRPHLLQECTALKKTAMQGHMTPPSCGHQKVAVAKTGRVNYTTMEDIPEGEQVLMGTFSLNGHPTTVLFDLGLVMTSSVRHALRSINW
jgi:hypothetical protein